MAGGYPDMAIPLPTRQRARRTGPYTRILYLMAAAIVGAALIGALPIARAQEEPIPLDDYWARLQETLAVVTTLAEAGEQADLSPLETEAVYWESVTSVVLPGGSVVPVDHSYLVGELRARPPDLDGLSEQIEALLAYRDFWPTGQGSAQDGRDPFETLAAILARPTFGWNQSDSAQEPEETPPGPLDEVIRRLLEGLDGVLPDTVVVGGDFIRVVLIVVGALALAAVAGVILRNLLADMASGEEADLGADGGEENITSEVALKRARAVSAGGDYRTAVRYLYLSSLLWLEERGLLRYDRSRTNREYVRSVAGKPGLADSLQNVVNVFDQVWYGYRGVDAETYSRYERHVDELRQQK